jgi:hypothetical protein
VSLVITGRGGGLKTVVIASFSGLPIGSLPALAPSTEIRPPEPPAAETAPSEGPAPEASAAEAPPMEAPPVPPTEAPPTEVPPTEALPTDAPVIEARPAALPTEGSAVPTSALKPALVPRDSIFDAGRGRRGQVTVAIGGLVDALDPRSAAGATLRVPQLTSDVRVGLGTGWSAVAHLNTIVAINEIDLGLSWSFPICGKLRGLAQFQAGVFVGMLGSFGFESTVVAPEFRPLVGVSLPVGTMRWSLRGEILFAGPYVATLGEVSDTLATPPPVANWNIALVLENLMKNNRLWYSGLMIMASTASYQNWLLFPDTSQYDYYPRLVAGYEF